MKTERISCIPDAPDACSRFRVDRIGLGATVLWLSEFRVWSSQFSSRFQQGLRGRLQGLGTSLVA